MVNIPKEPKVSKLSVIVIECIKSINTVKNIKPTLLELFKIVRGFYRQISLEVLALEIQNLQHAGFVSVEHGSNRWSVKASIPH